MEPDGRIPPPERLLDPEGLTALPREPDGLLGDVEGGRRAGGRDSGRCGLVVGVRGRWIGRLSSERTSSRMRRVGVSLRGTTRLIPGEDGSGVRLRGLLGTVRSLFSKRRRRSIVSQSVA